MSDVPEKEWPKGTADAVAAFTGLVGTWSTLADCSGSSIQAKVDVIITIDSALDEIHLFDQSEGCGKLGVASLSFSSSEVDMGPRSLSFSDAVFEAYLDRDRLVDAHYEIPSKTFAYEGEYEAESIKSKEAKDWITLEVDAGLGLGFGFLEQYDFGSSIMSYGGHCDVNALSPFK